MTTQMKQARSGSLTLEIERVASEEGVSTQIIIDGLSHGRICIPCNQVYPKFKLCGIGSGLRTKVNANIGTSKDSSDLDQELEKLAVAIEAGADTVMDLSTGGKIGLIRQKNLTGFFSACRNSTYLSGSY